MTTGLVRVAVAAQHTRVEALERTIAQQQALLALSRRPGTHSRNALAAELGMPVPAAQAALSGLHREGLVTMEPSPPDDVRVELTECGRAHTPEFLEWAAAVLTELSKLGDDDQRRLLQAVTDQIIGAQRRGQIPITKMCVTCRHFEPYAHPGTPEPHHCHLVDTPLGYRELRLRGPQHSPA
nr:MarR family winged helix-turn-helix transcriptional regulator [Planosporangium flavigriseum]